MTQPIDLDRWVDEEKDPSRKRTRTAVRLVLRAIADTPDLTTLMTMKGGMLMSIVYHSRRFTKDIDLSTQKTVEQIEIDDFIRTLTAAIDGVSANNDYGLALRYQSYEMMPKDGNRTFQTMRIKIGYADRSKPPQIKKLNAGMAASFVPIEFSFNEWSFNAERQDLADGSAINVYHFHDLVAEKFRAFFQQIPRDRQRAQDIYDLSILVDKVDDADKPELLGRIIEACQSRPGISISKTAMRNEELLRRSKAAYETEKESYLSNPPDFEPIYNKVRDFFESLTWKDEP